MISAVLIYGQRGEILASRVYKDGLRRAVTDAFRVEVISNPENQTPLLTLGSTSFLHIRHKDLYVVAVTRHNVDAALIYEFLYKLVDMCTGDLGSFDEASCQRNMIRIYEIFDELVDFGYPQYSELDVLRQYLSDSQESSLQGLSLGRASSVLLPMRQASSANLPTSSEPSVTPGSSGSATKKDAPWRRSDIRHRRNEVYVDVIEELNIVLDAEGKVITSSVDGHIQIKTQLTGMPTCRLILTDADMVNPLEDPGVEDHLVHLEDCQLHECADHQRFQASRAISFLPPEGDFELLRYRVTRDITKPFLIRNEIVGSDGDYTHIIHLKCLLDSKVQATNVVVNVPTIETDHKGFKGSSGKAKYRPGEHRVEWRLGRVTGGLDANLRLPLRVRGSGPVTLPPITLEFKCSMITSSGLKVRQLKVMEDYTTLKWVRYMVQSGKCEARVRPFPI